MDQALARFDRFQNQLKSDSIKTRLGPESLERSSATMIKFWKRQRSPEPSATSGKAADDPDPANSPAVPQAAAAKPARAGCWGWLTAGATGSGSMDSSGLGGGLDDGGGGE